MLNEKKSKRGTVIALLCALALLALVILLENTMKPTGMLFTVLKKGAVYALVAVSINLLNGFTGLFSLGQAGFMLLGAYTYAIIMVPEASRESVYRMFLPLCDRVYVTRIAADGSADAFFPDLEHDPGWRLDKRSADMEEDGLRFRYEEYVPVKGE